MAQPVSVQPLATEQFRAGVHRPVTIEIDGVGRVEVGPEWNDLTPDQQQAAANEMAGILRGSQQQGQQIVSGNGQEPTPMEHQRLPDWLHQAAPIGAINIERAIDEGVGAAQGVGHVLDNAAGLLESGYNRTLGHIFGQSQSAEAASNAGGGFEGLANQAGHGGDIGRPIGEIGASALLTRGMGGPIAQGMGTGALLSEADNPLEFARDVAVGGAGGYAGERVARGLSNVLNPVFERGAELLHRGGTRLTPGQYLPALREFEDKSLSLPFAGPQLQGARRQGFEDFAVSVPRQALDTVAERLPHRAITPIPEGATGQEAIRHTGDQISAIYEDVIPRLSLNIDPQLTTELGAVSNFVRNEPLTEQGRRTFQEIVDNSIVSRLRGRSATGREYEAVDTDLERQIGTFGRSSDPDHQIIANALRDIRATLRNGITRQNGQLGQELDAADEAWAMLAPAEEAASQARRGFFSPAQYRSALRRGDDRVRRRGMARGEVRGQEYAEAGQDILPPTYPNPSGTASHEAYNIGNARFWQGGLTRMLYGPNTQNFLTKLTIDRPQVFDPFARTVGQAINALPTPQASALLTQGATNSLFGF